MSMVRSTGSPAVSSKTLHHASSACAPAKPGAKQRQVIKRAMEKTFRMILLYAMLSTPVERVLELRTTGNHL